MPAETSPLNRICLPVRNALFVLAGLLGLAVLVRFVFIRSWNYDEITHVHMAWLVSVGEVPYRDFAINHFPFFYIPVSALLRILPHGPGGLMALRGLSLLFNAVFIGSLGVLMVRDLPATQRICAIACFGIVVFNPVTIHYLVEIRPDALGNAILFPTLAWLLLSRAKRAAVAFSGGFLIGAGILINTKFIAFPLILAAIVFFTHFRQIRETWRFALALCSGFATAVFCGFFLLHSMGVVFEEAWRMVMTYNAAAEKAHTYGYGLALAVMRQPALLGFVIAGAVGCGVLAGRKRLPLDSLSIAILVFLIVNLLACTRPWKQYTVPWFLLAAYFPSRFGSFLAVRLEPRGQIAAAFCILAAIVGGLAGMPITDPNRSSEDRVTQDHLIEWVGQNVPPDGFVAAGFPMHPVFRRDTFFKVAKDMTSDGRDTFEQLMPLLSSGTYREHFQLTGYEKELDLRPPSVVVSRSIFTQNQIHALSEWLQRNRDDYEFERLPGTDMVLVVRTRAGK
jgi:hypothetical protein